MEIPDEQYDELLDALPLHKRNKELERLRVRITRRQPRSLPVRILLWTVMIFALAIWLAGAAFYYTGLTAMWVGRRLLEIRE